MKNQTENTNNFCDYCHKAKPVLKAVGKKKPGDVICKSCWKKEADNYNPTPPIGLHQLYGEWDIATPV